MESGKAFKPYGRKFDKIAGFYDLGVKLLCLPFGGEKKLRDRFIDFMRIKRNELLLDVCCGTGTLITLISKRVRREGMVIGVDLSLNMIKIARGKVKGLNASFLIASAEALPLREKAFDKALCSFGLHEMGREIRLKALKEVKRVLRSSGKLYVFDYSNPKTLFINLMLKFILKVIEENTAYEMVFKENLIEEVEKLGFKVERRGEFSFNLIQMIELSVEN